MPKKSVSKKSKYSTKKKKSSVFYKRKVNKSNKNRRIVKKKRSRKKTKKPKKSMKRVTINGGGLYDGMLKEKDISVNGEGIDIFSINGKEINIKDYLSRYKEDDELLGNCKELLEFFFIGDKNQLIKIIEEDGTVKYYTFYISSSIKQGIEKNRDKILKILADLLKNNIKKKQNLSMVRDNLKGLLGEKGYIDIILYLNTLLLGLKNL